MCFAYIENSVELGGREMMVNGKDQLVEKASSTLG